LESGSGRGFLCSGLRRFVRPDEIIQLDAVSAESLLFHVNPVYQTLAQLVASFLFKMRSTVRSERYVFWVISALRKRALGLRLRLALSHHSFPLGLRYRVSDRT
jgi:hypothetical protein